MEENPRGFSGGSSYRLKKPPDATQLEITNEVTNDINNEVTGTQRLAAALQPQPERVPAPQGKSCKP